MSIPVVAKRDLEGYILETTITVNIPQGTEGELVNNFRNDVVIVQFNVPSLGALRVSRDDLIINDTLESVIREIENILSIEPYSESDAHRALDAALLRTIEILASDDNHQQANQIISLFKQAPKHYHTRKKET